MIEEPEKRRIPAGEVGCKICEKSIYRIFVEHIQSHLDYEQMDRMTKMSKVERDTHGR